MYTNTNYKPFASQVSILKSKSTDNFYKKATQKSLQQHPTLHASQSECLACKHERQTSFGGTMRQPPTVGTSKTIRKSLNEQYYKTKEEDELVHIKKTKRYLQQLLDKTKNDFKRSVDLYEKRLTELTQELKTKNQTIFQLKKIQSQKEAEQNYLANASLVQTYKQTNQKNQDEENNSNRKIKQLVIRNEELEDQLASIYQVAAERLNKMEAMQLQIVKMKQYELYSTEFEAMKTLIDKMEQQKLRLLDRQHIQLQQFQNRSNQEKQIQQTKIEELRNLLETKMHQLQQKQTELNNLNHNITLYRDEQYEALKQLLQQRQTECLQLESRLNCIQAELNFVKGRYGYIFRMAQNDQLIQSRFNDPEEICLERVGRYQVSNGKESILGMNLSPIKRR